MPASMWEHLAIKLMVGVDLGLVPNHRANLEGHLSRFPQCCFSMPLHPSNAFLPPTPWIRFNSKNGQSAQNLTQRILTELSLFNISRSLFHAGRRPQVAGCYLPLPLFASRATVLPFPANAFQIVIYVNPHSKGWASKSMPAIAMWHTNLLGRPLKCCKRSLRSYPSILGCYLAAFITDTV